MSRIIVGGLILFALLVPIVGATETVLFEDAFESYSLGTLPIGPTGTWCYLDSYSNCEAGWPKVEDDGAGHGQVLHVYSPWSGSRQHPGVIVDIPAIEVGDSLDLSFDLRLNTLASSFLI